MPAVASPDLARRLGRTPHTFRTSAGTFTAKVTAARETTPAFPARGAFLLVDRRALPKARDTVLLVTGAGGTRRRSRGRWRRRPARRERGRNRHGPPPRSASAPPNGPRSPTRPSSPAPNAVYVTPSPPVPATPRSPCCSPSCTPPVGAPRCSPGCAPWAWARARARLLLALESLPQALLAAAGGALAGWAAIGLLADGLDLRRVALGAARGGLSDLGTVTLRAEPWSLLLPAAGVVALTAAVAFAQAWWTTRRTPAADLRTGDDDR